jgi:hypothetical protein
MSSRIISLAFALLAPLIFASCATVEPVKDAQDPRLDQLLASMDRCLANQAQTTAQLENQAQQLQLQLQEMQSMGAQLDQAQKARKASARPVPVACPKAQKGSAKPVVGYVEQVWFPDLELALSARVDTGVETSSLDAQNIQEFERDGKRWVRFEIVDPKTTQPVSLERKLKRSVGSSSGSAGETVHRPVVQLGVIIGRSDQTAEFVLYDRSHKTYQLKVGRNILQDLMVVDVSKKDVAPYVIPNKTTETSKGAAK